MRQVPERLASGFNRNIVECKGTKITNEFYDSIVLIETLWNVKEGSVPPAEVLK